MTRRLHVSSQNSCERRRTQTSRRKPWGSQRESCSAVGFHRIRPARREVGTIQKQRSGSSAVNSQKISSNLYCRRPERAKILHIFSCLQSIVVVVGFKGSRNSGVISSVCSSESGLGALSCTSHVSQKLPNFTPETSSSQRTSLRSTLPDSQLELHYSLPVVAVAAVVAADSQCWCWFLGCCRFAESHPQTLRFWFWGNLPCSSSASKAKTSTSNMQHDHLTFVASASNGLAAGTDELGGKSENVPTE